MLASYERTFYSAQGYCELGMYDEALGELDALPLDAREHPDVVELKLVILMQAKRWRPALSLARSLCRLRPEKNIGYIHTAFCLHELGKTVEARDTLLRGPESLHREATYHYNLACYECALGNLGVARAHLDRSFDLDKKFRDFAKTDPDLECLRKRSD